MTVTLSPASIMAAAAARGEANPARHAGGEPLFRFALMTDIQYADTDLQRPKHGNEGFVDFRGALSRLRTAVDGIRDSPYGTLPFAIQLGDIIDGNDSEELIWADFDAVSAELSRLPFPVHHVLGNHCLLARPHDRLYERLGFGPLGTGGAGAAESAALNTHGSSYYSFCPHPSWRFIILDAVDVHVARGGEMAEQAQTWLEANKQLPNAVRYNGGMGTAQWAWLEAELEQTRSLQQRALIFLHLPISPEAALPHMVMFDNTKLLEMLKVRFQGIVLGIFSGHFHPGGYAVDVDEQGTLLHHVTFKAILEAPEDTTAYSIVHVYEDRVLIEGHGVQRNYVLYPTRTSLENDVIQS